MNLKKIYKHSHKLGFDTVNAPDEISPDSCQTLQNLFPGHPNPTPRDGFSRFMEEAFVGQTVYHIFPWNDSAEPKILIVAGSPSSKGLYWAQEDDVSPTIINASLFPGGENVSFYRVRDSGYLITDKLDGPLSFIVNWNGVDDFEVRNANIVRPPLAVVLTRAGAGNVSTNSFISFAFTFVRRTDADSQDGGGEPDESDYLTGTFNPGVLESVDDIDNRFIWNDATAGGSEVQFAVNKGAATIDPQATHLRVYVTAEFSTQLQAEGAEHRWYKDIPITGTNAFSWNVTDTYDVSNSVQSNNTITNKMVGWDPIPEGKSVIYLQGRLWVSGAGVGQNIGRIYYSELPQDVEFPQKWFSMFNRVFNFKDASLDDIEAVKGLGVSRNDIFFILSQSLWYLPDGDPELGNPRLVDSAKGTSFPNTIFMVDDEIYYLANSGPARISGRNVEDLSEFTAAEVWPKNYLGQRGYFFTLADKESVRGFYYKEAYYITNVAKCIGHYMPRNIPAIGPFSIAPGDAEIKFGIPCVVNDELCVICGTAEASFFHKVLDADNPLDIASEYEMICKSKEFYASKEDLEVWGECFDFVMFVNFTDTATFKVKITCDYRHFEMTITYRDWDTEHLLNAQNLSTTWREALKLALPEGLGFQHVSIEWKKLNRMPYDFEPKGFKLNYLPKTGNLVDFISPDLGELVTEAPNILLWLEYDEDNNTVEDLSIYERDHVYAGGTGGSKTFDSALIPGGGFSFAEGTGSEVADTDWEALALTADGLWSEDWTIELEFSVSALSAVLIAQESGNGDDIWRIWIDDNGAIHFGIRTYDSLAAVALDYKFSSPNGTIVADGELYTAQFVLSNFGMNGKWYVAKRDVDFISTVTTRSEWIG